MNTAVRCNCCLSVWVQHVDEDIVDEMRCPYCGKDESLSLRTHCDDLDDAVEIFGEEEREEAQFDDHHDVLELEEEEAALDFDEPEEYDPDEDDDED